MKPKPKVTRLVDGRWQVQRAPFGFSKTGHVSHHDSFRTAMDAALGGRAGSGGSTERMAQHDYDRARGPA